MSEHKNYILYRLYSENIVDFNKNESVTFYRLFNTFHNGENNRSVSVMEKNGISFSINTRRV